MVIQGELLSDYGSSRQFEPVEVAQEGARRYTGGRHSIEGLETTQANPHRGFKIQQAYKEAQAAPAEAPGIRHSYEAMRQEVGRQYRFMTAPKEAGGMGLRHEVTEGEPYWDPKFQDESGTSRRMAEDVATGRIKTHSSASTPHAIFSERENDMFRAVHDVFGHAATGRGFSRHGEEAAYLSHRQMFSREAQAAIASETRGQNSMLNYGATIGDPEKRFPEQAKKLVGLPRFAREVKGRKS